MGHVMLKKLPLDIQTFRELRESNYLYVDKTEYAYNLITGGRRFFLSRPRRFGKSLFVSTLHEILSGNKELFTDLWIGRSNYEWKKHPVISLSLSSLDIKSIDLFEKSLCNALQKIAEQYSITSLNFDRTPKSLFMDLIEALHKKFGKVAILVDEYDYPILRSLDNEAYAIEIRDALRDFFIIIKDLDASIAFVFITGVSSFAKAGIFSGLNNLQILTLNDTYGTILGYTDEEVDHYFKDYMQAWSEKKNISYQQLRQEIKTWYNGYHFSAHSFAVYNPFSLMNAFNEYSFKNFWIQSGPPSFLMREITKGYRNKQLRMFDIESISLDEDDLGTIDIGAIPLPTLIFQTGYLTIDTYDTDSKLYKLKFPNAEIKHSFQKLLFNLIVQDDPIAGRELLQDLKQALIENDMEKMIDILKQLFSRIPNQLLATQEKFYHAILQIFFDIAGIKSQSEYATGHGRIDIVLELPKCMYIIETKLNQSPTMALEQIEEKRYWEPFLKFGKLIILLGLSFERGSGTFDITYAMKKL